MTNLTISLDDATVRDARIKAIQEGTSVSAKVREFLRAYVDSADVVQIQANKLSAAQVATARLMQTIAKASTAAQADMSDVNSGAASGTLRAAIYADDFRKLARDAALDQVDGGTALLAVPTPPAANNPSK